MGTNHTATVVAPGDGSVTLRLGGEISCTAAEAMNRASDEQKLAFIVFQQNEMWLVRFMVRHTLVEVPFRDGMKFWPSVWPSPTTPNAY